MTQTFALSAATALTVLAGKYMIHRVTFISATAGIVRFYDSVGNAVVWNRPAVTKRLITGGQTLDNVQDDCCGNPEVTITQAGATDAPTTIAAGAGAALPVQASIPDGNASEPPSFPVKLGLTAVATVAGNLIVDYEVNLS